MNLRSSDVQQLQQCYDRWVRITRHAEILVLPDVAQQQCTFRFISGYQYVELTVPVSFDAASYIEPWSITHTSFQQLLEGWENEYPVDWRPISFYINNIEVSVLRFQNRPSDPSYSCDAVIDADELDFVCGALYKFMDTESTSVSRHSLMVSRADKTLSLYATN